MSNGYFLLKRENYPVFDFVSLFSKNKCLLKVANFLLTNEKLCLNLESKKQTYFFFIFQYYLVAIYHIFSTVQCCSIINRNNISELTHYK